MKIPIEWTFESREVAVNFEAHVREQLPWYELVTDGITQIARHFIGRGGLVYDIGTATGNISVALRETIQAREAKLIAIDSSQEMIANYQGAGDAFCADAELFHYEPFDLAVCNLVLTFLRPDAARELIRRLITSVKPDGAIILVERMLPTDPYLGIVTSRMTIAAKVKAGSSPADILAKELSLGGVQRPLSSHHLQSLGAYEWFRFGDFAGWILLGQRDE